MQICSGSMLKGEFYPFCSFPFIGRLAQYDLWCSKAHKTLIILPSISPWMPNKSNPFTLLKFGLFCLKAPFLFSYEPRKTGTSRFFIHKKMLPCMKQFKISDWLISRQQNAMIQHKFGQNVIWFDQAHKTNLQVSRVDKASKPLRKILT